MVEFLKSVFRPSVNKVISGLQKKVKQLEALVEHHGTQGLKHQNLADGHRTEAVRASRIAEKFKELVA